MAARLGGPWTPLNLTTIEAAPVTTGVYEIADLHDNVLDIGCAGTRALFGLRTVLAAAHARHSEEETSFRIEQCFQYSSRLVELQLLYRADHNNELPPDVVARADGAVGKMSPD